MKTLKQLSALLLMLILGSSLSMAQNQDARTITIKGTDNMKFDVTEIEAKAGETLRIVFTTKSKLPKQAMAHNVVVLDKDADVMAFANASAAASDNEYIAPDMEDQVVAATALAGGGETVEVTFTVPDAPGSYEYICSFPGHFFAGMKGVIKVSNSNS